MGESMSCYQKTTLPYGTNIMKSQSSSVTPSTYYLNAVWVVADIERSNGLSRAPQPRCTHQDLLASINDLAIGTVGTPVLSEHVTIIFDHKS